MTETAQQNTAEEAQRTEPEFLDALYHQKRKHGKYRVVPAPCLAGPVVDTHAHIQMLDNPPLALARCAINGVPFICDVCDVTEDADVSFAHMKQWRTRAKELIEPLLAQSSEQAPEEAARFTQPEDYRVPQVRIIVGCHPHNAEQFGKEEFAHLRAYACDQRVCAIGEIGLDYFYDFSPRDEQRRVFKQQLLLAHELDFPVALHVRDSAGTTDAHDEALEILSEVGMPQAGVLLHCYTLDTDTLRPWVERGCYVAFGGAMTFRNCPDIAPAARIVPLDRLLLETDSPYMAPEPLRGTPCQPDFVVHTAARMCENLGATTPQSQRELLLRIEENARRLFVQPARLCQQPVKPCGRKDECSAAQYCVRGIIDSSSFDADSALTGDESEGEEVTAEVSYGKA